ncbi:trimeric intracellular cation channel family protein [Microvirga tunisiensis]|uniref:Trimeric intracellular cation channel family protein n=1 Tax=Pannonibacter tanglangensis TaxID=2750084 RepID=A0A7X5JBC5_9HYPH|nr:trimeric intracellular cation channel family protein [Pannonibacter sp. XCT-53]NBN80356.1 trimeric intracellular cation channel family protein [Pannonibacter sp. XCT-53]
MAQPLDLPLDLPIDPLLNFLQILDYLGVAVFAVTGAIVASRKNMDLIAFLFFATMTGIGGGTLRDLILGVPVFWTRSEGYLLVCFTVSVLMWFGAHIVEGWGKPLRWADAVGLAAYCVMGSAKALSVSEMPVVAVLMGVATATFGGILRDVVVGDPSAIVKPELYISAAVIGSTVFVILTILGLSLWPAAIIGAAAAFVLRAGAITRGWTLPSYRPPAAR